MNAKKLFALMAVAIMVIAPLAVVAAGEVNAEESKEIKEGMHLKFKDLDYKDLEKISDSSSTGNASTDDDFYYLALAILMPGVNPLVIDGTDTDKTSIKNEGDLRVSAELDYSHFVNADKTEGKMKIAGSLNIKKLEVELDLGYFSKEVEKAKGYGLNVNTLLYTPEVKEYMSRYYDQNKEEGFDVWSVYDLLSSGSYAKKLMDTYSDKAVPSKITLKVNDLTVKAYAETNMKDCKAEKYSFGGNTAYVFTEGGYPVTIPQQLFKTKEPITFPLSSLKLDASCSVEVKMDGADNGTFETKIKADVGTDVKRNYEGVEPKDVVPTEYDSEEKTKVNKVGTKFADEVRSAKFILTESNKFRGESNDKLIDCNLSDTLKAFINQHPYSQEESMYFFADNILNDNIPECPNKFVMLLGEFPITASLVFTEEFGAKDCKNDEDVKTFLKNYIDEKKFEVKSEYNEGDNGSNDIRNQIDGKSDNNMMVVGIVIAVIIILALVALWYFKFRPQKE